MQAYCPICRIATTPCRPAVTGQKRTFGKIDRLDSSGLTRERNLSDMTMIGTAASAKHPGVGKHATKLGVFAAKLHGIAVIEVGRLVELGMAAS